MRKREKKGEMEEGEHEERKGGGEGKRGKEKKFLNQIYIYSFSHMKVES